MFMGHFGAAGGTPRRRVEAGMPSLGSTIQATAAEAEEEEEETTTLRQRLQAPPPPPPRIPPPQKGVRRLRGPGLGLSSARARAPAPAPGAEKGVPPTPRPRRPRSRRGETPARGSPTEEPDPIMPIKMFEKEIRDEHTMANFHGTTTERAPTAFFLWWWTTRLFPIPCFHNVVKNIFSYVLFLNWVENENHVQPGKEDEEQREER
ncbi:uncharacterized protein [Pseudorca crassidens]|uniref:uncharacterized protein n=1 Tax=Pseudorca crassidens TaxID=82174 RepID=UPI00352C12AA